MISQLILSTVIACQNKAAKPKVTSPAPTKTQPQTQNQTPPKEPLNPYLLINPDEFHIVDSIPVPRKKLETGWYSMAVHASDIFNADISQFCTSICSKTFNEPGWHGIIPQGECTLELIRGWEKDTANYHKTRPLPPKKSERDPLLGRVECQGNVYHFQEGRRMSKPSLRSSCKADLAGYFACAAQEEAISVYAFRELLCGLVKWNAPKKLIMACTRAIEEEKEHAAIMIRLAKAYGAKRTTIKIQPHVEDSLFKLALNNAVIGCIEETWAAALALYRAQNAPKYSNIFMRIAKDEEGHAQLSWDIHHWVMSLLSVTERKMITAQMTQRLLNPIPHRRGFVVLDAAQHRHAWNHFVRETLHIVSA